MKCLICDGEKFERIHKGTRDIASVNVMKCIKCGMIQLDSQKYNTDENYVCGGMLKASYGAITDTTEDMSWETWIQETEVDDDRRYKMLTKVCAGKSILEFGCGNGGFLRKIKRVASDVAGIELMAEARKKIQEDGIPVYETLDDINQKYDIICMFMVIEHLNNPKEVLRRVQNILNKDGLLICETVNSQDALISKYQCQPFEDFTFWSEHVYLYNSDTLEKLMLNNGFITRWNTQIQRYSLANHLYWLSKGRPGGHIKWTEFSEQLNNSYAEDLIKLKIADTLWYGGTISSF